MKTPNPLYATDVALALIAFVGSTAPVLAQPLSHNVSYADLDLTSPQGQAMLDRRIRAAARDICGGDTRRTGSRMTDANMAVCIADVKAKAAAQVAAAKRDRQLGG